MMLAYIQWNPDPEIINLLGFSIRYYGTLFMGGIILSLLVLSWIYKSEQLPAKYLDTLAVYGILGIIAGARLGHCLFYEPDYYLANPLEIFLPVSFDSDGGFSFVGYRGLASHGGALGLIVAVYFYSRKTGHAMLDTVDLIGVVAALAGGFIRLANLMNSEIIGIPTTKPWAFVFERVDAIPRHPAQLYESVAYFLIFAVMYFLYKNHRPRLKNGFFFGLALVLIFVARFILEFFKENQVEFEDGMLFNMGQLLSLPYIFIGIGFMIYGLRKTKNETLDIRYEIRSEK